MAHGFKKVCPLGFEAAAGIEKVFKLLFFADEKAFSVPGVMPQAGFYKGIISHRKQ